MPKLTLIRGLPGSGKSTLARQLATNAIHLETDQYWERDGKYVFNPSRLGEAHKWCQEQTYNCLKDGHSVVVSNTFTTVKELRPYFDIAKEFGTVPTVIVAQNQFENVHNVPRETLAKMRARFVWDIGELFK